MGFMNADAPANEVAAIEAQGLTLRQHGKTLLDHITLSLFPRRILAIIGPSNSGKSAFLKAINRLLELEGPVETSGRLLVQGQDVYDPGVDVTALRRRIGMVFSRPSLPVASIFENVALAQRMMGVHDKAAMAAVVERCLRLVGLWEQVANRQNDSAASLSAEAQQRLCIARVLATDPVVLLFDEPTAHLDYPSAGRVEDLICELAKKYPVLLAAQTPQQASHIAQDAAFFWQGRVVETGTTEEVLTNPKDARTEAYVTGRLAE